MNPIMQATLDFIDQGKQITRIIPEKNLKANKKVTFQFANGTTEELQTDCDHPTFMQWWKHTGAYLRATAKIQPLEDIEGA